MNSKFWKDKKCRGIFFFDIDDTLFDTSNFIKDCMRDSINYMKEQSLNLNKKKFISFDFDKHYKSNAEDNFDRYLKECGFSQKEIERLCTYGIYKYHLNKRTKKIITQKAIEKLKEIREQGFLLGIISRGIPKKQWEKLILMKVDSLFEPNLVFITEEEKSKEFYTYILKNVKEKLFLEENHNNFFMVGDREDVDILNSKKAGFKTIKVFTGRHSTTKETKADYSFNSVQEIDLKSILN